MPIRGLPNGVRHTRPQAGRDHPQQVVAIDRNGWSRSIVAPGRDHPLRAPVRLEWLSDQVPTRFKRLNGLCCGAAGCRLKFRECRRGPRERVGTREEAERHPLGRTEFAVIALSLYQPSRLQQELCRFARRHDRLFEHIIAFRNQLDNRSDKDSFVSKLVGGFDHGPQRGPADPYGRTRPHPLS